ncbi:MAG TPA: hypothetical protein VFZ53_31440, partial [Polyangiaceae bacterium]
SRLRGLALLVGIVVSLGVGAALSVSLLKDGADARDEKLEASPSVPATNVSEPAHQSAVAPAPKPPSAKPSSIEVQLSGAPEGAEVLLGDRKLGVASSPVSVPYGHEPIALTITAPNHEPKTIHLTPSASTAISVSLAKMKRAPKRTKHTSSDLENPF